jgi:hypothetical protein
VIEDIIEKIISILCIHDDDANDDDDNNNIIILECISFDSIGFEAQIKYK